MRRSRRILLQAVYLIGIFALAVLTGNKYDWMREMDPSIPVGAIEDHSGDGAVLAGLVLVVTIAAQLTLLAGAERNRERVWAGVLVVVALLVWTMRAS